MHVDADVPGRGGESRRDPASVGAAAAELLRAAEAGSSSRAELRELRAALSHIDAELGPMPLSELRDDHVRAVVGSLRDAGLSPSRERAIVNAIDALRPRATSRASNQPTPTDAMLAVGGRLATFASVMLFTLLAGVIALTVVTLA
jgi:hypothetical protein